MALLTNISGSDELTDFIGSLTDEQRARITVHRAHIAYDPTTESLALQSGPPVGKNAIRLPIEAETSLDFTNPQPKPLTGKNVEAAFLMMSKDERAAVAIDEKHLRFVPEHGRIELVPGSGRSDPNALQITEKIKTTMLEDPVLVDALAQNLMYAVQLFPEESQRMMNEIRKNNNLPELVEADLHHGNYKGTVVRMYKNAAEILDVDSKKLTIHRFDKLSEKPVANHLVEIKYSNGEGAVNDLSLKNLKKQTAGRTI